MRRLDINRMGHVKRFLRARRKCRPGDFASVVQPPLERQANRYPLGTTAGSSTLRVSSRPNRSGLAGPSVRLDVAQGGLRFDGLLDELRARHAEPLTAAAFD